MPFIFLVAGKVSFPAISGFAGVCVVTWSLHRSLLYVSLSSHLLIIRNANREDGNASYAVSEISAVRLEYSAMRGCRMRIKRGRMVDVYDLLLVGESEMDELKKDLLAYGVKVD